MKTRGISRNDIIKIMLISSLLTGCELLESGGSESSSGSGACSESIVRGQWKEVSNTDVLTFNSDCSGTSTLCGSTFDYNNVTGLSGSVLVTIKTNQNMSCLGAGMYSCAYVVAADGMSMAYDCGGGVINYNYIP